MVLGSHFNPQAKFTGFLVCHPSNDDVMHYIVCHALHSSLTTATFMLLPNWKVLVQKITCKSQEKIQSNVLV